MGEGAMVTKWTETFPEMISKERDGSKLVSPLFAFTYCQNSSLIPFLSKALWAFFPFFFFFLISLNGPRYLWVHDMELAQARFSYSSVRI